MAANPGTSLAAQIQRRDVTEAQWHTLANSLFPGAAQRSVLMVIDYCKARGLDPLKKPCHIVPMKVNGSYVDVVMPGIYELRTTAQRTGEYMGHSKPEYGPLEDYKGVNAPAWCHIIIYRWHAASKTKVEFPVTVFFEEAVGETWDKKAKPPGYMPNARWKKAPRQMLTKCAEAAGLREAFPDALGGEMSAEEMTGRDDAPPAMGGEFTTLDELKEQGKVPEGDQFGATVNERASEHADTLTKEGQAQGDYDPPAQGELIDGEASEVKSSEDEGDMFETMGREESFTWLEKQIRKARNLDELNVACDLIGHIHEGDRKALRELYMERLPQVQK